MLPILLVFFSTATDHCDDCIRGSAVKVVELKPHEMRVRFPARGDGAGPWASGLDGVSALAGEVAITERMVGVMTAHFSVASPAKMR